MRMRKIMMGLALLATISAGAQELTSGIDRNNMNLKVKPGNDFYEYAAGGWMKSHPLDAEHADNGACTDLFELSQEQVRGLILGYADGKQPQGSLGQKIGSLYRLAMDSVRRNREGAKPIQPVLQRVAAVKNVAEYQRLAAELDRRGQASMLFGIGVGADLRDAKNNIVSIGQGGMGLGTRDYYLNDDAQTKRVREAYRAYIVEVLRLAGYDEATAQKKMEATMAIETRLARVAYDQVKLRDISANYHKMTYAQFCDEFPGIDWGNTFLLGGFPHFEYIDVSQPEPIHEVEKILADTPLDDLKSYMEVRVVTSASGLLSDDFRAAQFRLSSTMTGLQQDKPRWKRAVSLVNGCMGMALGKMYVEKYFPESSKERMVDLVHRLQDALAQRIDESTWMSQETKEKAKDKLRSFIIKIGYPDKWKNYDGMKVDESLSLYDNVAAISDWETCDVLSEKVGKPVDKMEWQMTPQTINAYYNPTTNEICFPAAILQPPFFDPKADDAANLGAIGGVIGHEMSHGFDDQGAQFDKDGNQNDWWTAEDKANFNARTKVLADYFSTVEAVPGRKINGQLTLGENIGDNGGLNIAFRALQNTLKVQDLGVKDGFTPEQRFFLSWARVWASNMRPEYIEMIITTDPHSPSSARVNAALPHIDAWYKAFNVKKGQKLFIPANKRARIW